MIRKLKLEELPTIRDWYRARENKGWVMPPQELLPFDEEGNPSAYVYEKEDKTLTCCGWLYTSNSQTTVIDWFVSNPKEKANLKELIKHLIFISKDIYKVKFVVSLFDNNPILKGVVEDLGFTPAALCTNYIKAI